MEEKCRSMIEAFRPFFMVDTDKAIEFLENLLEDCFFSIDVFFIF